ncbi:MAG: insulinase family protein [Bacteroidales bacterium]|nr:insulinase family protein [Bacteroidales bacterium]
MISGKTSCGLQYAVRKGTSSVAYCALSIKCGTRNEGGFHNGIAHFVEHTIFKGTSRKSASVINGYLDRLGGELNAFTTKEEIVFHATVLKEDLPKAASLLFELATSPIFPEREIEVEKGVVIDEINSYKDSPSEDIYDRFEEMLFDGHPLSGNILGTPASVKKIDRDELLRFVKEKFIPCSMAFTIVADMDEKIMEREVMKLAQKFFPVDTTRDTCAGGCAGSTFSCRQYAAPAAVPFDKTLNKKNHQANCIIGGLAPSLYQDRERVATVVLCNILGGPAANSRLNSVLRERNGWVYNVECGYTQFADTGIASISLGCDKSNIEKCIKTIYKEIGKLQEELLSDKKLKAAKKQLLGQLAISSDNGETICLSMGKGLLAYGRVSSAAETTAMIEAVTSEDVREMARTVFDFSKLSKLVYI